MRDQQWMDTYREVFGAGEAEARSMDSQLIHLPAEVLPGAAAAVQAAVDRWDLEALAVRIMLLRVADEWAYQGVVDAQQTVGWLQVLARAPSEVAAREAIRRMVAGRFSLDGPLAPWAQMPGQAGAWVWAAGMSPEEAAGVPESRVREIAALRGWPFTR